MQKESILTSPAPLELYKLAIDEEHTELETHQKRAVFYKSTIVALFGATFVALRFIDKPYEFVLLGIVLPIIVTSLGLIGSRVSRQFYERFLDAVTRRAKIEQILGLTEGPHLTNPTEKSYWASEGIVPTRHIDTRTNNKYKECTIKGKTYYGSQAWIKHHLNTGYHKSLSRFFILTAALSISLGVAIITVGTK